MNSNKDRAEWLLAVLVVCLATAVLAQSTAPTITAIRAEGTNCVVTVNIPAGLQRVTLETSDRAGRLSWLPRAVVRPELKAGVATFRLPMVRPMELIRVRADLTEPVPGTFFLGTNSFSAPSDNSTRWTFDSSTGPGTTPNGLGGDSARAVVESDIWKIQGNTLYFFNQYRGLQVIDITNPDLAFVRGTLELPAAGEQMYVLEDNRVVLLARAGCSYDESQVLVVADTNGPPQVTARLPVAGTITESRLVGTALYVASQTSRPLSGTTNTVWEWGTLVSAFDLATPDQPVIRNTLWYPGYGNVVSATDTYLFVVTQAPGNYYQSVLNLVDITDPAATIFAHGSITNRGRVPDKFKLNYSDAVLAAISEDRSGSGLVTRLETFHLSDPRAADPLGIFKLGELELGHGEQLHATRFDGQRVYVVTFFRIDPLWVVDFSNARVPRIAGSVEVPGWSTYIQPLGDRLVTLGIETNRVSVSLYDVANPAAPARLSVVTLGANYSWSEANYDEKAFTLLPDAGLMLVPFSGDTTNGYASALQLIDYSRTALRARGQVQSDSGLSYRRATLFKDRVLSLSGWELLSVNATDRDHPVVSGRLVLAESVNRLLLAGDYLVQFSAGNWWDATTPVVSVAATTAPERVLDRRTLAPLPLLGAVRRGDRIYLAQGTPGSGNTTSDDAKFVLTVISVPALPELTFVSQTVTNTKPLGWSRDWQALWPSPDVLVWAGGQDYWWWCDFCPMTLNGGFVGGPTLFWPPPGSQTGGNGHLIAFDVRKPDAPRLAGQVDLNDTNRHAFSRAYAAAGLIHLSHQTAQFVPDPAQTNSGKWVYRSFLDVVDFADPGDPLVREPVNIPNSLVGVSPNGAILYTLGYHWNLDPNIGWREYLEASAYDGVAAHLVDSIPLPAQWPHPAFVLGDLVLVGDPGDSYSTNPVPPILETWVLSNTGKFTRVAAQRVLGAINDFAAYPGLLAATDVDSNVSLFVPGDAAGLRFAGTGRSPLCWWWPDLGHSDGSSSAGLWIPLGAYGVTHIPISP
jgi:hypothetical protein